MKRYFLTTETQRGQAVTKFPSEAEEDEEKEKE